MKVGDTVVITDGSWTRSIIGGKLVSESLNSGVAKGRHYTVIKTDCGFPLEDQGTVWEQPPYRRNDTVIQDENGKVVLVHSGFLRVVKSSHVWKHGDVFKNNVGTWVYLKEVNGDPYIVHLINRGGGTICLQLKSATFLFNIKDKL
jgi:hypothetical protein